MLDFPHASFSIRRLAVLIEAGGCYCDPSQSATALPSVRGAHFHFACAPLSHQIATLGVRRGALALPCVCGVHFHHKCAPSHTKLLLWGCAVVRRCSCACVVLIFIIKVHLSHIKLLLLGCAGVRRCSRACVVLIFLGLRRGASVLSCVRGAHFQLPWLDLAALGCPWLLLGCSWLLLAAPGLLLAAPATPGCSWLLLAASGCSWLVLAAMNVNSGSKENNLFGVLRWDHQISHVDNPVRRQHRTSIHFEPFLVRLFIASSSVLVVAAVRHGGGRHGDFRFYAARRR
jgi:hypothetical protein